MGFSWIALALVVCLVASCVRTAHGAAADGPQDRRVAERQQMVEAQLAARGIEDRRVLAALTSVPRHAFVTPEHEPDAYLDCPLPIGHGQTISQPYIVALMTEALELEPGDRVLEVGTGSGYQAAVLGVLCREVFTIEIVPELATRARRVLEELDQANVHVRTGDGYMGWPEEAPFDAVILTAAPDRVPTPLVEQLKPGGKLVLPVGETAYDQSLLRITKHDDGSTGVERLAPVRFVPMTGVVQDAAQGGR